MNSNEVLKYIDSIPYLSRAIKTLEKAKGSELLDKYPDLKIVASLLSKVSLKDFTSCKGISRFSIAESEIEVINGSSGYITFSLLNPIAIPEINIGDLIQLKVNSYYKERDSQIYNLYQDNNFYSTCYLSYIVSSYKAEKNEGVAILTKDMGINNLTIIGVQDSVLRKMPIAEIFNKYLPNIEETYIL